VQWTRSARPLASGTLVGVCLSAAGFACYVERGAPEAGAVGDTRVVISAEAAYQGANSGYYGTITCLAKPAACIPSYPANGPTFLDPGMAAATVTKWNYTRTFFERKSGPGAPPGSVDAFCYGSRPDGKSSVARRAFGGDSTGVVGETTDGSASCCTADGRLDVTVCPPLK
jgi:hypothetical protein